MSTKKKKFVLTPYVYWEDVQYRGTSKVSSLFVIPVEGVDQSTAPGADQTGFTRFMGGLNMRILDNFYVKTEFNFTRVHTLVKDPDKLNDTPGVDVQFCMAF